MALIIDIQQKLQLKVNGSNTLLARTTIKHTFGFGRGSEIYSRKEALSLSQGKCLSLNKPPCVYSLSLPPPIGGGLGESRGFWIQKSR